MKRTRGGRHEMRGGRPARRIADPVSQLLALCCLSALAGCAPPGTSARADVLSPRSSEGQEIRAGQRAAREAARTLGVVADQALQDYVQQVGTRLASSSDRSQLPWTFRVLDDPMPNAFGMPGGYVFVTRGILGVVNSEAELAGVLAHEIGHVNARHGFQALRGRSGAQLGVWAVPIDAIRSLDEGSSGGGGFLYLGHDAAAERQADELGVRYMVAAGYDAREMADVFSALGRLDAMGGRSALPSWLTTHPDPGGRVETAAQRAGSADDSPESVGQNPSDYLDQIEDLIYGHDPRQGIFRGSTFLHPELRFRVDLPAGWRYRNLAQAVVATSADRVAAIQLTIVEQAGPSEAADRFLRQAGVAAAGNLEEDTIDGNALVVAQFRAGPGAAGASGTAAWIGYGGRTFQIVGIAAGRSSAGHAEAFQRTIRSFAPLTDARVSEVRPNRINIVRLGRATTFAEFNRRYPSAIDAEEVALLNRVTGPTSRLRAGTRMKRVVKG